MSNNAVEAYAEGKKPVSRITKEDVAEFGIDAGITFFRWYVKRYCRPCEWHHSSPKFNQTNFYDVEECCNQLKGRNIETLKAEYKSQLKAKPDVSASNDDKPYYARVEYSIGTFSRKRKHIGAYAIVNGCWAYIQDDYKKKITRKNINGKHFCINDKYESRPGGMPEDGANAILGVIYEHRSGQSE
jgi:hypothetical protein